MCRLPLKRSTSRQRGAPSPNRLFVDTDSIEPVLTGCTYRGGGGGGAEWVHLIQQVDHHSDQVVSDHIPVVFTCQLTITDTENWRPKSYFKMGPTLIHRQGVLQKIKTGWENHPPDVGNAQRRWELAWIRVREILRKEKKDMTGEHRGMHDLRLQIVQALKEVFQTLTNSVSPEQDQTVGQKPTEEEIEKIAHILGTDKSPGLDGVTTELLLHTWDFVKDDCCAMIDHFWTTGKLIQGTGIAVIKLLPKNQQKNRLKNWRPLSLMSLSYKIIAKLVAERIRKYKPDLVDPQQVGFIQGRNITSNLLGLRLAKDWAKATNQASIFLKLDFIKAYDRIDQGFLLQTLEKIGFGTESMKIFRGLTCSGKAKVHVNQDFTGKIAVQRGVRQGCPLAPYLFAISTQVLMDQLNDARARGLIRGIHISQDKSLLHQLFADDTGICLQLDEQNFLHNRNVLARFEIASGAKLNLHKTMAIPLFDGPSPHWLASSGCCVAQREDRFRYLGVLEGLDVMDEEIATNIKTRYDARINHWANRFLTWPEKTILCRNVLGAMPYHTLMTVGLSKLGMKQLQKSTREFLWGESQPGRKRKPLIAWETFEKRKLDGGLGWPPLTAMADAFTLTNVIKMLTGAEEEWVQMANQMIVKAMLASSRTWEFKTWTPTEILLGLKSFQTGLSPTLDRMLKTWYMTKKRIMWDPNAGHVPVSGTPNFLMTVAMSSGLLTEQESREITAVFKKAKVKNLEEVHTTAGPITIATFLANRVREQSQQTHTALRNIDKVFPTEMSNEISWLEAQGWTWGDDLPQGSKCWKLSTAQWRKLLYTCKNDQLKLNNKWNRQDTTQRWNQGWKNIWGGKATYRTKIRVWRFIRTGYFTNSKARDWGLADGICSRCATDGHKPANRPHYATADVAPTFAPCGPFSGGNGRYGSLTKRQEQHPKRITNNEEADKKTEDA
ncbi:hypothetical protein R1sor_008266 [Riccia sorocarpa]|uniref:Reverse transcriptase domain-containing protein n=1 Tax=Riccia sorocarpa TaxID=122646 RepID=A0ABD3HWH5_9MARC